MSRTEDLEKQERERRWAQTLKLQKWAAELKALDQHLWDEDKENGWHVRMVNDPQLAVLVTIDGAEFPRFVRDEVSIIGVFDEDKHIHLLCGEGAEAFNAVPSSIRHLGPWSGGAEGEINRCSCPIARCWQSRPSW